MKYKVERVTVAPICQQQWHRDEGEYLNRVDYGRKSGIHCGPEGISQPFEFPKRLRKDEVFLKESWSLRVEE